MACASIRCILKCKNQKNEFCQNLPICIQLASEIEIRKITFETECQWFDEDKSEQTSLNDVGHYPGCGI